MYVAVRLPSHEYEILDFYVPVRLYVIESLEAMGVVLP
jgi:hypothetical protein